MGNLQCFLWFYQFTLSIIQNKVTKITFRFIFVLSFILSSLLCASEI
uniref:Uncharacterized protein n=1 Tax=Rhizophora mucronata TaxID=61149 RepID=A0A2P2MU14_RHIMU